MKKITLITLLTVITIAFLNAQIYTGINSKIALPTGNYVEINNGIGVDLLIGYLVKQKLDFNISASNSWFNTFIEKYKIRALNANIRYFIIQKSLKPYIEFGTGYFHKSFKGPFETTFTENGIGIIPSIGILFDSKMVDGLFVNTEFSYCKIYTKHEVSLINFNIGLLYYFESKK